jgi:hypothetical protein
MEDGEKNQFPVQKFLSLYLDRESQSRLRRRLKKLNKDKNGRRKLGW